MVTLLCQYNNWKKLGQAKVSLIREILNTKEHKHTDINTLHVITQSFTCLLTDGALFEWQHEL